MIGCTPPEINPAHRRKPAAAKVRAHAATRQQDSACRASSPRRSPCRFSGAPPSARRRPHEAPNPGTGRATPYYARLGPHAGTGPGWATTLAAQGEPSQRANPSLQRNDSSNPVRHHVPKLPLPHQWPLDQAVLSEKSGSNWDTRVKDRGILVEKIQNLIQNSVLHGLIVKSSQYCKGSLRETIEVS